MGATVQNGSLMETRLVNSCLPQSDPFKKLQVGTGMNVYMYTFTLKEKKKQENDKTNR